MSDMALDGVRILDLTHHIAGPFCTQRLAGYGANVIKIERPDGGDPTRRMGPFKDDDPNPEKSGMFFYLNMNKRGVTLNLKSEKGREVFKELVKGADLVVESFRPHVMRDLGLSYQELRKVNPHLVMTSITSFGQYGPYAEYKATEMVVYGMGGAMINSGVPEREPVSYGTPTAVYYGGSVAAVGTVAALMSAKFKGIGQHVDVSVMECLLGSVDRRIGSLLGYQYSGEYGGRESERGSYATDYFPCKDGMFCMAAGGRFMFPRLVKMMGNPELLTDPRYLTPEGQRDPELRDIFEAVLINWSMDYTKKEIAEKAAEVGLICAAVNTMEDVAQNPHFNVRGTFVEVEHPVLGTVRTIGRPFVMHETPWQIRRPAPLLGEHNTEVYGELGYTPAQIIRLREAEVI